MKRALVPHMIKKTRGAVVNYLRMEWGNCDFFSQGMDVHLLNMNRPKQLVSRLNLPLTLTVDNFVSLSAMWVNIFEFFIKF